MTQPFDPVKFLGLARELASQGREEARLRTAVGRAYYALFLIARGKTGLRGKKATHRDVIKAVKKRNPSTGHQLDALFRLRKLADYQLLPDNQNNRDWIQNWNRAEKIVNHVLPKLRSF